MNKINTLQNEPENIELLAAQRYWYSRSKQIYWIRIIIPMLLLVSSFFTTTNNAAPSLSSLKIYISLFSILYLFLDIFWLEKLQLKLKKYAAQIQEQFDCKVLDLEWNNILSGNRPAPELIKEGLEKFRKHNNDFKSLSNWYAPEVSSVDLKLGRVLCQRSNIYWDSKQRKQLIVLLIGFGIVTIVVLTVMAIKQEMKLSDLIISTILPLLPGCNLLLKQLTQHSHASERLDTLKNEADRLIDITNKESADRMLYECRLLQNEIYNHRKSSPSIPDWYYYLNKKTNEGEMIFSVNRKLKDLGY